MDSKTEEKLALWISLYPESKHSLNTLRMYDFVREACMHGDVVSADDLKRMVNAQDPKWVDSLSERFVDSNILLIENLMGFYDFCMNSTSIDDEQENKTYHADSIEDFMDAAGELNYHEIYELSNAINGYPEALNFFEVKDDGKFRTVTYTVMYVAFTFRISIAKKLSEWLEDHYMDGLDAESWYGFMNAMEKDD